VTYRGLDSFRLFAFLAVFLYHVDVMPVGYLGVLAFFVLSGFLITPILVEMRGELSRSRFFINFYGRRSLRIFPLYYFYLALMAIAAGATLVVSGLPRAVQQIGSQLGYALTYTYDFFHASSSYTFSPLLTHFWSLAVEEQFYLVWPLVVFGASLKNLKRVLMTLIVAGPLIRLIEASLIRTSFGDVLGQRIDLTVYVLPFSHIDAFAIGGYLALFGRRPSTRVVAAYSGLLVVVGMLTERLATGKTIGLAFGYAPFMADSWKSVWAYSALELLFGWILLMIRDRAFFRPVFEHATLAYLGRISYGLYVYHFGVIWLLSQIVSAALPQSPQLARLVLLLTAFGTTVAVSMVSYSLIEEPMLRLKDRYFAKSRVPAAMTGVVALSGPS
jgi:peptidoglycan/LPS O-acetylase OafA/YrhL